jgi:hypothetical protein
MKAKFIPAVLFFSFVFLGIYQGVNPLITVQPIEENRELVELPKGNVVLKLWKEPEYFAKLETYFSENFPLRDSLIRLQNQIMYSLFRDSKEIVFGIDGWVSDKEIIDNQLPALNLVLDGQIEASILKIKRLQEFLRENNQEFLVVIVPMKPTVYFDKFPSHTGLSLGPSGLDRFQVAMKKNGISFIDVKSKFLSIKDSKQLYYKTDMHWNTLGSAVVAEDIIKYFSKQFKIPTPWDGSFLQSETDFLGGESQTMPLLQQKPESVPVLSKAKINSESHYDYSYPVKVLEYAGTNSTLARLPSMKMFGNSFMLNYPLVGLQDYFKTSSGILDYELFSHVLDYIRPEDKIFIWHIYETQLLFHVLQEDKNNYWDNRIDALPLPGGYKYRG